MSRVVVRCGLFGHRYRFHSDGPTMVWRCQRGCGAGGIKTYPDPATAARFAAAFDREDHTDLGVRAADRPAAIAALAGVAPP
jgi:hypothetical protein